MTPATVRRQLGLALGLMLVPPMVIGCGPSEPPRIPPSGMPASVNVPIDQRLVESAKATLIALTQSAEPADRAHGIEGLRDGVVPEAAAAAVKGLDDKNQIVRFAAAFAAGELKVAEARPKLLEHLLDPDLRVRAAVRFALHKLGDTSRTAELETYAQNFDPQQGAFVRGATAFVLGRIGEPSALGVLRLLRIDDNPVVRLQAEESLFLLGEERAEKAIAGLTLSKFPDDQMLGLRVMGERGEPRFRNFARNQLVYDYPEVALVAAMALGAMDADDGFGVALKEIKAGPTTGDEKLVAASARRRSLAAAAMGWIGRPDAQALLSEALKDPHADVRANAATAILRIARRPKVYARNGELIGGKKSAVDELNITR